MSKLALSLSGYTKSSSIAYYIVSFISFVSRSAIKARLVDRIPKREGIRITITIIPLQTVQDTWVLYLLSWSKAYFIAGCWIPSLLGILLLWKSCHKSVLSGLLRGELEIVFSTYWWTGAQIKFKKGSTAPPPHPPQHRLTAPVMNGQRVAELYIHFTSLQSPSQNILFPP